MLALGWIASAIVLFSLRKNISALPIAQVETANLIDGQPPPPCLYDICPQLASGAIRAIVPVSATSAKANPSADHRLAANLSAVPRMGATELLTDNGSLKHNGKIIRYADAAKTSGKDMDVSDAPTNCSSSSIEAPSQDLTSHADIDQSLNLKSVHNHSDPYQNNSGSCDDGKTRCSSSDKILDGESSNGHTSDPHSLDSEGLQMKYLLPATDRNVPASCLNGKVRCLSIPTNISEPSHHAQASHPGSNSVKDGKDYSSETPAHSSPCAPNRPKFHFPGTHQTAPITCGDGTPPPCGGKVPVEKSRQLSVYASNDTSKRFYDIS